MEPEDLDLLYRIENDRELWDVGVTNVPYSRYSLYQYISDATGDIYADRQVRLVVERMENEDLRDKDEKLSLHEKNLLVSHSVSSQSNHSFPDTQHPTLNVPLGLLDIFNFDPHHLRAELGIVIQQPYRRCGYATQALRQAIDYARHALHLHQLYAYVDAANEASRRAFLKAGFESFNTIYDWLSDGKKFHDAILMQYFL